jgi:hypothetical protein
MHSKPFRDLGGEQIAEQVFARRQSPTASSSSGTLADDSVTNAKLANMAASTIKARKTASTGDPEDCTLSEVLDFIGSAAQGDILYRGSASWARLAAGTSGQYLKTLGTGANPAWDTPSGGGGGMTLVTTVTVSGSPATSMTASGLDLDTDKNYVLQVAIKEQTGVAINLRLFFNSDTTTTNYDSYVNVFSGGGFGPAGWSNAARFIDCAASDVTTGFVDICKDFNARPLGIFRGSGGDTSALRMMYFAAKWRTAGTNVTGITLSSTTASSLAVGSFFKVWKLP